MSDTPDAQKLDACREALDENERPAWDAQFGALRRQLSEEKVWPTPGAALPTTWQDHAEYWQKRAVDAEVRLAVLERKWSPVCEDTKNAGRVLLLGQWNERAAKHCVGLPHVCIGAWSSFMSDGSGYKWIYEGSLGNMHDENIAVTFKYWMPLPKPLVLRATEKDGDKE